MFIEENNKRWRDFLEYKKKLTKYCLSLFCFVFLLFLLCICLLAGLKAFIKLKFLFQCDWLFFSSSTSFSAKIKKITARLMVKWRTMLFYFKYSFVGHCCIFLISIPCIFRAKKSNLQNVQLFWSINNKCPRRTFIMRFELRAT